MRIKPEAVEARRASTPELVGTAQKSTTPDTKCERAWKIPAPNASTRSDPSCRTKSWYWSAVKSPDSIRVTGSSVPAQAPAPHRIVFPVPASKPCGVAGRHIHPITVNPRASLMGFSFGVTGAGARVAHYLGAESLVAGS